MNSPLYRNEDYGREAAEPTRYPEPYRSDWRLDHARLIHSPAFRRLQGKTQLFPGESDFFRNRLTHSLEVAQIAKSIAVRLNHTHFGDVDPSREISPDLVEFAALALASILKYDHQIGHRPKKAPLQKGYYSQEAELVRKLKLAVAGDADCKSFKTVECKIMDIADDIAYSTYDFEDALKAGFTSLLDILGMGLQPRLLRRVALKVWKRLNGRIDLFDENNIPAEVLPKIKDMEESVGETLVELTLGVLPTALPGSGRRRDVVMAAQAFLNANAIAKNGYLRTSLTSQLVGKFIRGVEFQYVPECPPLSKVFLSPKIHQQIEILKIYNYEAHIDTARLKTVEFRGKEFVIEIFNCLTNDQKNKLLPEDFRVRCEAVGDENHRLRTICDFVAGMTDKYALEFYDRLKSGESTTIFKDF